jgi:hypothetical protein
VVELVLREDDGEDGVRSRRRLVHVGRGHRPEKTHRKNALRKRVEKTHRKNASKKRIEKMH